MERLSLVRRMWSAAWAPLMVVAFHSGLTAVAGHRQEYDPVFHFLGGAAGAYSLLRVLRLFRSELGPLAKQSPAVVVMAAMLVIAGLWECAEFISDRFLGTHIQLSTTDTISDVLLGTFGAICTLTVAAFFGRDRRMNTPSDR